MDVAVDRLVAMGFDERRAKKALADTDSGNSVDFDKAVAVLVRERKRDVGILMHGCRGEGCVGGGIGVVRCQRRKSDYVGVRSED